MKLVSVRTKLLILILIVLIPLIVLQFYRIENNFQDKIESELDAYENLASAVSTSFVNYIKGVWVQEGVIGLFFTSNNDLQVSDIQSYLRRIQNKDEIISSIHWISPDGTVLASTVENYAGTSLSQSKYVRRLIFGEEMVVSNILESHTDPNQPIIPVARTIWKDGKFYGIISIVIDINKLSIKMPNSLLPAGSRYGLIDGSGMIVFRSDAPSLSMIERKIPYDSLSWKALQGQVVKAKRNIIGFDDTVRMSVDYPIQEIGWDCFVSTSYDYAMAKHYKDLKKDFILLALISLISIAAAFFLANRLLHPIFSLKNAANSIMNGDYSARTNIQGYDEIAVTAQAFDRMAEGIGHLDEMKNQFFLNISHEFKTPINVIFVTAQLLLKQKSEVDYTTYQSKVKNYMKVIMQNCYRLLRLVSNLIDITRSDGGFLKPRLKNHNIVQVVEDITLSVVRYAEIKGISLVFDTETEEKIIACDPNMIERVMLNLISNSLKFTKQGGSIFVNIYERDESVIISVKDTGIGIPADKLELIFDRFGQVDTSLSRNNEGSGIGLSLVKALVEAHHGKISVDSKLGEGSEFIIELPADAASGEIQTDTNEIKNFGDKSIVEKVNVEFSDIYHTNDLE